MGEEWTDTIWVYLDIPENLQAKRREWYEVITGNEKNSME